MMQIPNFMIEEMQIRWADAADADALASLIAEPGFDYATEISLVRERMLDALQAGNVFLIAAYRSQIVGMAHLHRMHFLHRPPDGRVVSLVVAEAYRSHGVGAQLLAAAEEFFRQWGCGRVEITSGAKREAAHRFYIRASYTEQPKRFIKLL